jgi:hypothetical protein
MQQQQAQMRRTGEVAKLQAKSPLSRPMHRWEDNIKADFKETVEGVRTRIFGPRIGTSDELL